MKIECYAPEKSFETWRIIIREIEREKYKLLLKILDGLGMSRQIQDEQRLIDLFGYIPGINRIFNGKQGDFQYYYNKDVLAGGWKAKEISGEEFLSVFLSNKDEL